MTETLPLTLWALGLLLAAGWAILELLSPGAARATAERWGLSFLLGAGAVSWLTWGLSPLFGIVSGRWLVAVIVFGLVAGALRVRSTRRSTTGRPRPAGSGRAMGRLSGLCLAILVILLLAICLTTVLTPLGWDGLFNFELKARAAILNEPAGRIPLAYFADADRAWTHPGYPLLVPLTEAWVYLWLDGPHQSAIKLLFPAFFASLVAVMFGLVRRRESTPWALAGCLGLVLLPAFTVGPGEASSGYADVPLAAFVFGAVGYAALSAESRAERRDEQVLAGLLAGMAVWTKQEGLVLVGLLLVALAAGYALSRRRDLLRACGWIAGASALVVLPWWLFRSWAGVPASPDLLPITVSNLVVHLDRWPVLVRLLAQELLRAGRWAALWPAFFLTTLVAVPRWRTHRFDRTPGATAPIVILGTLVLIPLVFVFSAWDDPLDHVGTALPRLLLPLAPLAWLATFVNLREGHRA